MPKPHEASLTEAVRPEHPTTASATHPSGTYRRTAPRQVVTSPAPILQQRASEIDPDDEAIPALVADLVATMRAAPRCTGIAAPQIGEPVRVVCVDVTGHRRARSCAGLVVLVNPMIVALRGNVIMREGCLSVPDVTGDVARAAEVTVSGFEPVTGWPIRLDADAIEARCLLHELDHLDGYLFTDRVLDAFTDLYPRRR